jgi:hypothetical protein
MVVDARSSSPWHHSCSGADEERSNALEAETKMSEPPMFVKSFEGSGQLRMSHPQRGRIHQVPPTVRKEE